MVYLPLPPQDVLFHSLLGQFGGLHGVCVLFEPGMFVALSAREPSPEEPTSDLDFTL